MVKRNKKLLNWSLVIIWLGVIFSLSSIPGVALPQLPFDWWNFVAHRTAHIGEYSILGILVFRAYTYEKENTSVKTVLFLSIVIFLAGALDEWHQTFVPGRDGQLIDAIFDTINGTLGMLLYFMWLKNKKFYLPKR